MKVIVYRKKSQRREKSYKEGVEPPILKLYPSFCPSVPYLDCSYSIFPFMLILEVKDMATQRRCFAYEKNFVINALYDIIEALGVLP